MDDILQYAGIGCLILLALVVLIPLIIVVTFLGAIF